METKRNNEKLELIPSGVKAKLPKYLSFPVNATILSEAFKGVPQYDKLSAYYVEYHLIGNTDYSTNMKLGKPFPVLSISYTYEKPGLTGSYEMERLGFYDEKWLITVNSLPSVKKHIAKELLIEKGLPRLKKWLQQPRTETWRDGRHNIVVFYNPKDDSISFIE